MGHRPWCDLWDPAIVFLSLNGQLSVRCCKPQFPHLWKNSREEYTMLCISSSTDKVLLACKVVHKILHAHKFPTTSAGSSTTECSPRSLLCTAAQEPPGFAQGWVTWAAQDKGMQSLFLQGMGIISLQRFFTFLPHLLAFFLMTSSESRQHVRILRLCKCQELFIPHLPVRHRFSGASLHFAKLFPAPFWLLRNTRQIIKDSK